MRRLDTQAGNLTRMSQGGKRPNSGRKPLDPSGERRKPFTVMVTEAEKAKIRELLEELRKPKA